MTAGSEQLRFWIDMTLECIRRDHTNTLTNTGNQRGPFLTARAQGLALAALHDAHALASGAAPLLGVAASPGLVGANAIVAAGAACQQVLVQRYPKQSRFLDPAFSHWIERFSLAGNSAAEAAGRLFGKNVEALGAGDAATAAISAYAPAAPPPYAPYQHVAPANDTTQGFAGSRWGQAVPLLSALVPFPKPPGRIDDSIVNPTQHFRDDFAKVTAKGVEQRLAAPSADQRTLDEETIGIFWGYDGPQELGTPPRLYLQVALTVLDNVEAATPNKLNTADELRIVAAIGIAMADAGIQAWHYKYSPDHMMWRPAAGIRNPSAGNGTAQPGWLPLGRPDTNGTGQALTPDFPAYPSGHATFGAAAFQLLRLFLVQKGAATFKPNGIDNVDFDFVSDEYNGRNTDPRTNAPRPHMTRSHDSLWQAISENSLSRVYLGVHWQFDGITRKGTVAEPDGIYGVPVAPNDLGKIGGVWLGGKIANQIAALIGVSAATIANSKIA